MPREEVGELDNEVRRRIERKVRSVKSFRQIDLTLHLIEVNEDYARTMNKIIFERVLEENGPASLPLPLALSHLEHN
jgi:dynein heavy chain